MEVRDGANVNDVSRFIRGEKRMTSRWFGALVFFVAAGCGKPASAPPPKPLPASAAGTSSAAGPGVPAAFSGTITHSIELTDEERAAIAKANELSAARDPNNRIHTSLAAGTP